MLLFLTICFVSPSLSNFCQKILSFHFFEMGLTSLPPIWTMSLNILFFLEITPHYLFISKVKCVSGWGGWHKVIFVSNPAAFNANLRLCYFNTKSFCFKTIHPEIRGTHCNCFFPSKIMDTCFLSGGVLFNLLKIKSGCIPK